MRSDLEKVGNWNLFKFSESLQLRMENLLEKKVDQITPDEIAKLNAIGRVRSHFYPYHRDACCSNRIASSVFPFLTDLNRLPALRGWIEFRQEYLLPDCGLRLTPKPDRTTT